LRTRARTDSASFAVVVPAHNEEAGIRACVAAVDGVLAQLPNRTAIIVVDDGSTDATAAELAEVEPSYQRLVVERHERNRGYGAALGTGARSAAARDFEFVLFMDSDLTNDPAYLPAFARLMDAGVDVIKASRYAPGGGTVDVPRWRVAVSVLGNAVARLLYGLPIRDCTNGFRAVRTRLLSSMELHENGFAIIMEELYWLAPLHASYAEVPIVLVSRGNHLRPSSFSFGLRSLARYLKYPALTAVRRLRTTLRSGR